METEGLFPCTLWAVVVFGPTAILLGQPLAPGGSRRKGVGGTPWVKMGGGKQDWHEGPGGWESWHAAFFSAVWIKSKGAGMPLWSSLRCQSGVPVCFKHWVYLKHQTSLAIKEPIPKGPCFKLPGNISSWFVHAVGWGFCNRNWVHAKNCLWV